MNINTKEFGEIQIEDNDIIKFVRGIYGFDDYKKFVILKQSPDDDIMYLQSIENNTLHFIIVDPFAIIPEYSPELTVDDLRELGANKEDAINLKYMLIAVINEQLEKSVVNLKSPIVINPNNKYAIQAILQNQDYPLRYPLFTKQKDGEANASN